MAGGGGELGPVVPIKYLIRTNFPSYKFSPRDLKILFSRSTKLSFFYEIINFRCSVYDHCLLISALSFQNTDTMYLL